MHSSGLVCGRQSTGSPLELRFGPLGADGDQLKEAGQTGGEEKGGEEKRATAD